MRLSEVLSEEERAVRFTGKRRKVEMERTREDLGTGGSQQNVKSTLENLMGIPRRSVIRPRSEPGIDESQKSEFESRKRNLKF